MPGVFTALGLLQDGKLTEKGKRSIIERHKKIQNEGGEKGTLFPCSTGGQVQPVQKDFQLPEDIEDESKYPEYHSEVLGAYEGILNLLDVEGNFSLPPPFIDPVALGVKLNGKPPDNLKFDLPTMASLASNPFLMADTLNLNPIELTAKLIPGTPDSIIKPPIPSFNFPEYETPQYFLNLKNISLPVPAPGFTIPYPDKILSELWKSPQFGLSVVILKLIQKIIENPTAIFDLISPQPKPCFVIDAVTEAGIFGTVEPGAVGKTSTDLDKIQYAGGAASTALVAELMGNGGTGGATGTVARVFNLIPEEEEIPSLGQRLPAKKTPMTKEQVASLFLETEPELKKPGGRSLAVLLAHWNLETAGGKQIWQYNFGNVKATGWTGDYQYFATNELFDPNVKESMNAKKSYLAAVETREQQRSEDDRQAWSWYDDNEKDPNRSWYAPPGRRRDSYTQNVVQTDGGNSRENLWFFPTHSGCKWRAFRTAKEGARSWIDFFKLRRPNAWQQIIAGNIFGYADALISMGYFTENAEKYKKRLISSYEGMLTVALQAVNQ